MDKNILNEIKSSIEYESKFSKEHRSWMVGSINEIKEDVKKINGRVRGAEVSIGWMKGIIGMISASIGWLIGKEL
tara:strand:- start:81 stop:305 length:225 start_codon:yes stop_codon:yes gene_type:complete